MQLRPLGEREVCRWFLLLPVQVSDQGMP